MLSFMAWGSYTQQKSTDPRLSKSSRWRARGHTPCFSTSQLLSLAPPQHNLCNHDYIMEVTMQRRSLSKELS